MSPAAHDLLIDLTYAVQIIGSVLVVVVVVLWLIGVSDRAE